MQFALVFVLLCFVSLLVLYVLSADFDARVLAKLPGATKLDSSLTPCKTELGKIYATGTVFSVALVCAVLIDKAFGGYVI